MLDAVMAFDEASSGLFLLRYYSMNLPSFVAMLPPPVPTGRRKNKHHKRKTFQKRLTHSMADDKVCFC